MNNMFHSAALRLTGWYLAIIMALSISFSFIVYHFAAQDLISSSQRQARLFDQFTLPDTYNALRLQNLADDLTRIRSSLVLFNISVFIAGGGISYWLARRTLEPIEENMEAQMRFTGDASHELRTPLTIMQTENEVALRRPDLTKKEAVEQVKSNLEEIAKLKALADGLLRLSGFDNRQINKEKTALAEIVKQSLSRWDKTAKKKDVKLKSEVREAYVVGDSESLSELMSLLIDNALKYSHRGGTVSIKLRKKDKSAVISVADTGQGIAPTDLPHVFERFYRADNSRTKNLADGYGLGLAIAKKIVDLHGGVIEVVSTFGKGSTFTVKLPRA
ncbi:MAG TPA: HAMP domain-containing sensor histidine kinase [Candidatus Saccharimonadales bacterium]|nr:HAMP domain-containing sensor histidine kinase [Candidatus Saccharimonadales bacterium]